MLLAVLALPVKKLKADSDLRNHYDGISSDDSFGFSALSTGYRDYDGTFGNTGYYALLWSATEYWSSDKKAYLMYNWL